VRFSRSALALLAPAAERDVSQMDIQEGISSNRIEETRLGRLDGVLTYELSPSRSRSPDTRAAVSVAH